MPRLNRQPDRNTRCRLAKRRAGGFTLIEASLTTVIIGVGVLAIVSAQQAYHMKNDWAQRTNTAQLLANELRELMITLPMSDPLSGTTNFGPEVGENGIDDYDDLDDFDGLTFSPPVNALRMPVADLDRWSQTVTLENVLEDDMDSSAVLTDGSTDLLRITVTVRYREPSQTTAQTITSLTWVARR